MENQRRAYIYTMIVVLFWATVASAFKISLRYLDFLQLLLGATVVSILVLLVVLIVQNKLHLLKRNSKSDYRNSVLLGLLSPFLYYTVLFKAYSLLPAQEAQPLNQTWAIVISLLSIILLKQKIRFKNILALLISFFGVLIISTQGNIFELRFSNPTGVLLALGSAFIWALFWVYNLKDKRDEVVKLFLNFVFAFPLILIFTLLFSSLPYPHHFWERGPLNEYRWTSNTTGLLSAVYVGLFEMGVSFVLWLKALKLSKTTSQISNFIYLIPFLSLIVIRLTVGERILLSTIIGLVFIVFGIIIQQRK